MKLSPEHMTEAHSSSKGRKSARRLQFHPPKDSGIDLKKYGPHRKSPKQEQTIKMGF